NISSALASALQRKTTYPPIVYPTNTTIGNTNLVLSPQAGRDIDTPDIGFHYSPVDFVFGSAFFTNSTILITNGAAIGTFAAASSYLYGLAPDANTTLISDSSPTNLNRIFPYNMAMEQANSAWSSYRGASVETVLFG